MGPSDWRRLLANPATQWRQTKSAFEAAVAWEAARGSERGIPPAVAATLDAEPIFSGASLLLGIPEHQVELEGGGHASQTDFWALFATKSGVVSVAVEAKAGEPFDRPVAEWLADASEKSGKPARLAQLCNILEISRQDTESLRYQLMHRPVAAILEAVRFQVPRALFLVHAFGDNDASLGDYQRWARYLGVEADANRVHHVGLRFGIDFWIGWVGVAPADDQTVRAAV
ncbi:DUF6946 family protein [Gemmatimonas sp. UBA7669]|uniref:DUF6946 family protein n=1 Tax=Gemmatimonas sp. UBA7669 TaxID=1946568 RepID=UPI0025BF84E0|nr:hypothetical protein [Gemmatimonas sp. UBA7669]